ncbi:hypothetical protein HS3_00468 [Bacillus subtilis]|nr:hypothetical protein HS3_00468 [Bacillus subtilis]
MVPLPFFGNPLACLPASSTDKHKQAGSNKHQLETYSL